MHPRDERRAGLPLWMHFHVQTDVHIHMHIIQHLNMDRENSHRIYITLSCQRDFFCTWRCRFTFSCWSKPLTQNTEWSAPARISHYLFGLFAAGQHKHPVHSSRGTACENKHAHRHVSCCAHVVWWMRRLRILIYLYIYVYKNKQNYNSRNNLKATQPPPKKKHL